MSSLSYTAVRPDYITYMDENNEIQTETVETQVPENTDQGGQETQVEQKPAVERPWNKKEPDPIPFHRFQEVNNAKRDADRRLAEYEARLAAYEAEKNNPKIPEIKDVDDIKPEHFKNEDGSIDNYAWMRAREKFIQEKTLETFEQRINSQRQAEEAKRQEAELANTFVSRLEESAKINPEVKEAAKWFSANHGPRLPPQVKYAIVTDENAPELIMHLCTDGTDIMDMFNRGDHLNAIRAMSRWSAKYTREAPASEESNSDDESGTPVPPKFSGNKPTIPTVKGGKGGTKRVEDMSKEEYRAWRASKK